MPRVAAGRHNLLPLANPPPPALRADAARNRQKILDAAAALFADNPLEAVSLDEVVDAAGVGKGTLFRIFGNKAGLAVALLDEHERTLQQRILDGPPPLGPGAGPRERLVAFIDAYVHYVQTHATLVRMSQTSRPGARFDTGSHRFWRAHLTNMFGLAKTPTPQLAADLLLAALTAEQVLDWTDRDHLSAAWLSRHLSALAQRLL